LLTYFLYVAFGAKRASLEQSYFEVYNQKNVELVSLTQTPIAEITETGIKMQDGKDYELTSSFLPPALTPSPVA
jgi:hypothetical protein